MGELLAPRKHLCPDHYCSGGSTRHQVRTFLEFLLEAQKRDDTQVDGLRFHPSAFTRTEGVVELGTKAAVDLYFAFVILPGHPEHYPHTEGSSIISLYLYGGATCVPEILQVTIGV